MKPKKKPTIAMQLPGVLALAAAGAATQTNAATVQITFNGSFISSIDSNQLDTDFGGDGVNDLGGRSQGFSNRVYALSGGSFAAPAALARGRFLASAVFAAVAVGSSRAATGTSSLSGIASASVRGLANVTFRDTNIRSGALTIGYLDITADSSFPGERRIQVNRLIFDDATGDLIGGLRVRDPAFTEYLSNAVPEPSSLGLLALGAGGLLARRRRSMAA